VYSKFNEKPADPDLLPDNPDLSLASMGIYVFSTDALVCVLMAHARHETGHDFGKHIIPRMIEHRDQVYAFPFLDRNSGPVKY
jgi:glucose-1-phosphate adenylyltransferase